MQTIVVTGATSGIGLAVCRELTERGHTVIAVGRSREKWDVVKDGLAGGEAVFFEADLLRQTHVNRVAEEIRIYLESRGGALDVLINNAGCVRSRYSTTGEGYEHQFALNHLAPFLLTHRLLPNLERAGGKVIMTSSASHRMTRINWNDIMFSKKYRPLYAYKQSKLCNVLFAYSLNKMYARLGLTAYCVDPGLVKTDIGFKGTGGLVSLAWRMQKLRGVSPDIPAKTFVHLCEERPEGLYFRNCVKIPYSKHVTEENASLLFRLSQRLCNVDCR